MPRWVPQKLWRARDAYVIGGGSSLASFDWDLLRGRLTIGCNQAYRLGQEISTVCVFGDFTFFRKNQDGLKAFGGPCFTNAPKLQKVDLPWLYVLPRRLVGLGTNELSWAGGNVGAAAVNLGLLLGVGRLFLLGFDMRMNGQQSNWHSYQSPKNKPSTYDQFRQGFKSVVRDWKVKFPGREIINVNDNSALEGFPKVSMASHFGR